MREKTIEQKFRAAVKAAGGLAVKFTSPGFDGVPDRLALLPDGKMAFVEVKAPGEKPRPLQLSRHRLLRRLGVKGYVLDACFFNAASLSAAVPTATLYLSPARWSHFSISAGQLKEATLIGATVPVAGHGGAAWPVHRAVPHLLLPAG